MSTPRNIAILGVSVMSLVFLPRTADTGIPQPSPHPHCYTGQAATSALNPKGFAKHSASFRKATEEAWRATHDGDARFEAGFAIDKDGHPGKVQLSRFATENADTDLKIASNQAALGTLHVHNKFGEATPSTGDIKSAQTLRKTVFVESRAGLLRLILMETSVIYSATWIGSARSA
jgi:hypothetical protein